MCSQYLELNPTCAQEDEFSGKYCTLKFLLKNCIRMHGKLTLVLLRYKKVGSLKTTGDFSFVAIQKSKKSS